VESARCACCRMGGSPRAPMWDPSTGAEIARLETDAPINCVTVLPAGRLIAGDNLGRLHWLEVVD